MSQQEELRRQISCLISIKEEDRALSQDEFEDAWYTFSYAEKIGDVRSQSLCLEIISSYATMSSLITIKGEIDTLRRIIDKNDFTQLTSNRLIAQELLDKISQSQTPTLNDSLQRQLNDNEDIISMTSDTNATSQNIERPTSTRMCLFQLSESNDINRVSLILDTLSTRSKESLTQMRKKYQFNSKLITILKKYCNGDYGFDQQTSRHGAFQYNLIKLLIILSHEYVVFLEFLQSQTIDFLSQIIEEGIIFVYEDALSGQSTNSNLELFKFLRIALDFIELAIGKQFKEFISVIRENLNKIQQRIIKLLKKKENALLNYFIQQYSTEAVVMNNTVICGDNTENELSSSLGLWVDQLSELKAISIGLYNFATELNSKIQRIEALNDFNEEHNEKHLRLFYQFISINHKKDSEIQYQPNRENQQKRAVQFMNIQDHPLTSCRNDDHVENQIYPMKSNDFIKKQVDISYKRLQVEKVKTDYSDKENQPHFIGSPIKPLQRDQSPFSKERTYK